MADPARGGGRHLHGALWLFGFWLRPDFWGGLDNSFNLVLAFTEIGLMAVGMSYVMANGDVDLSVGAVLALSGSTAAFLMKFMGWAPLPAGLGGFAAGLLAGCVNGLLATRLLLPAFVATLGMFYIARGIAAWLVAGRQLSQFPESYNLIGRKLIEILKVLGIEPAPGGLWSAVASALSTQSIVLAVLAVLAGMVLAQDPVGYMVFATGGNRRAAEYAGIDTGRVRFWSLVFSAACASLAGLIYIAYLPLVQPVGRAAARARRDRRGDHRRRHRSSAATARSSGALAGAAVITLLRALLSLQIILRRRQLADHAAALGQRVHRPDPDRGGAGRHLAAPGGPAGGALGQRACTRREASRHDQTATTPPRSSTCAASRRASAPCGRWPTSTCGSIPARSWAWSATTRPASRR